MLQKFQINNNHILYIVTGSLLFLTSGFLVLSFLCPFTVDNSYATTERTTNGDYYIETTTTDLNLTINTTPAGAQETASHDVVVKTDDPAGFTLTVSVNNDTSNALNLNGSTSATEKFNATSGTYATPKALDENSWGFADTLAKKNADQWAAVPLLSNAQQIKQTSSATPSGDTTTVHYGINAKYDSKHSNGNYSNTIVYSVTGNTIPVAYMQDFTAEKCSALETWTSNNNSEITLIDSRDGSDYKVRKLADGNCWMVQNLRLTADTLTANNHSTTLSASDDDTDLASGSFKMPSNISWRADSSESRVNGAVDATKARVGSTSGASATGISALARGAYYTWATAVMNLSYINPSSRQSDSVCPKTWNLPASNGSASTLANQFYNLYMQYSSNVVDFNTAYNYYFDTPSHYLAGYYASPSSIDYIHEVGDRGFWWADTSHPTGSSNRYDLAWGLNVTTSVISSQTYMYRAYGASIRCVFGGQ